MILEELEKEVDNIANSQINKIYNLLIKKIIKSILLEYQDNYETYNEQLYDYSQNQIVDDSYDELEKQWKFTKEQYHDARKLFGTNG